ncbi:MAG TPA: wax ester/triacylglycerol synthase family O-acyltransferase [Pseudonocardia sp.]|jgi:WS/DGAT/MGAT family acyltransferase|nr:wax ester/triacylglycerol synthase family O-acyltransferase [Pseudonocardia sp.]
MAGLNAVDRWFFMVDTPELPSQVAALITFAAPDGDPDFAGTLVADMRAQRRFAAPFNYRLRMPSLRRVAPAWEVLADDAVDLDYHLRHSALPRPGGERELGVLVSRLASTPLDPGKPLWELHIIEGLEGRRVAWFFKTHHGLMDGVGLMRRVLRMLDEDPASTEVRPIWTLGSSARPDSGTGFDPGRLMSGVRAGLDAAIGLGTAAAGMARDAVLPADDAAAAPFAGPSTVLNGRVGQQRRFASQNYELSRIEALVTGFGVSMNDVFLALCAGGLRAYLDELGALPEQSLQVAIPVSVRAEEDEQSSNAISAIMARLRTDIADPAERIAAISASTGRAKRELRSLPKAAGDLYGALALGPIAAQQLTGLAGRSRPVMNLLISTVRGPAGPLYLRGARLEALYALGLVTHGQALNISGGPICGRFTIGFTGCRDTLPHLQRLAVHTGAALEELEAALAARQRPKRERRSRPVTS